MTTGERIRKRRRELRIKQPELARRIGVTKQMISAYENGHTKPRVEMLIRLSDALQCEISDFVDVPIKRECEFPVNDDFGAICNCAVRYCLGRRSYMPKLVVDYITPLLPKLTEKTLACFQMDIEDRKKIGFDFGADCDVETWSGFYKAVCDEVEMRRKHEID